MSRIEVLHLIEGARQARGLVVILDVFRAFSLECYLYAMGAACIRPVETVEEAFALKDRIQHSLLVGERGGRMCEGFDYGNSPSAVDAARIAGKTIIHTTSAGTQGVANAVHAQEIIGAGLVNARATADYILRKNPAQVSLVAMGNGGVTKAPEDELCACYIQSILEGAPLPDMDERVKALREHGGAHFFDPAQQEVFPEADFWMCCDYDRFDFALRIRRDEMGFYSEKIGTGSQP